MKPEYDEYIDPGNWHWIAGPVDAETAAMVKAAPDLLAALEFMISNCPECDGDGVIYDDDYWTVGPTGGPCQICQGPRSAIAKATQP